MSNVLEAKERKVSRHSELRKLRDQGNIPAVVYGNATGSKSIYVSSNELIKTIKEVGRNGIISLNLEGNPQNVMLTEYQADPLKSEIYHVDFLAVNMDTEIHAQVRLALAGDSKGVKDGGVLQQSLHEVAVTAKPGDLPDALQVDVTEMQVGDVITVGDIKGNYNITINHEDEEVIASVLAPRQEEEISTGEQQSEGLPDNLEGRETQPE
ncbi:50S ribosomal protein L25/general stress protein Ctc [Bacillus sp. M6-12]|uniref:50S ribosomal protein L25/general stress protein Ctc n=1 Tax=Bacillus sp. M6-12 TaxID=2054166 RepID=UPI000C765A26|nr:50S ribosomal protein L25/general stress protein Ctc [Bacillus sp. M6-12]PLS15122.1 50S ribosomal protein L25/general stress protein Ctc [Bacillus sp. M6-12]